MQGALGEGADVIDRVTHILNRRLDIIVGVTAIGFAADRAAEVKLVVAVSAPWHARALRLVRALRPVFKLGLEPVDLGLSATSALSASTSPVWAVSHVRAHLLSQPAQHTCLPGCRLSPLAPSLGRGPR